MAHGVAEECRWEKEIVGGGNKRARRLPYERSVRGEAMGVVIPAATSNEMKSGASVLQYDTEVSLRARWLLFVTAQG